MTRGVTRKNLDLKLIIGITVLTALLVIVFPGWRSVVRIALGLLVVLAAPGYVLTSALFPLRSDIVGIERLALTLSLSVAVVPLLGLVLNYSPLGLGLEPLTITLALFVLALGLIARSRRASEPEDEVFAITWGTPGLKTGAGLAALVVVTLISVPVLAATLRPREHFTEFYVLGESGRLGGYPTELDSGEPFHLRLGVGNFEGETTRYRIVASFGEDSHTFETPAISTDERWEETVELEAPDGSGHTGLLFELYRVGIDTLAHRNLQLFVDIGPTSPPTVNIDTSTESEPMRANGMAWTFHPVQRGQTLYGIASEFLGDGNHYVELFDANRDVLDDPNVIPVGTVLRIPVNQ